MELTKEQSIGSLIQLEDVVKQLSGLIYLLKEIQST